MSGTLEERLDALESEVRELRRQVEGRPNSLDFSGTTAASTCLANEPVRPYGYGRRIGFGLPDITASAE